MRYSASLCALLLLTTACSSRLDRLEQIGEKPPLTVTENPQAKPAYRPLSWPLPAPMPPVKQYSNSLWQPGARAFFRDQRASRVGDILRVSIMINDRAELENATQRNRITQEAVGIPGAFGLETLIDNVLPGSPDPDSLLDITGNTIGIGDGSIEREEQIETRIAAVITQVLPNGNFVIHGSQEIQVNYEMREIAVTGIVRPEDIDSSNSIDSAQIAEARIVYGGRGQITDIQQPRYGHQIIDILSPF